MLTAVTQDGHISDSRGTGYAAAIPGYEVAGKTGTAQQVGPVGAGCVCPRRRTWITFAGMLPAQDPRYVVAIMLDAPQGGTSAAPLFHDIGSYLAQREKLPVSPDPQPIQTWCPMRPRRRLRPRQPAPAAPPLPSTGRAPAPSGAPNPAPTSLTDSTGASHRLRVRGRATRRTETVNSRRRDAHPVPARSLVFPLGESRVGWTRHFMP